MIKRNYLLLLLGLSIGSCFVIQNKFTGLPPGKWRAVLKLQPNIISPNPQGRPLPDKVNMTYEDVEPNTLPFNFEVIYDNDTAFHIEVINGEERIVVPSQDIRFGRSKERARDTIRIEFPVFESYISGAFAGNIIEGVWVVKTRENYAIPFVATHGKDFRFTAVRHAPVMDVSGKWQAMFGLDEEEPYPAVGEFKQEGNRLTGTFLTETGDYRYLEGTIQENKLWLSCFDGSHAFLFEAKINPDSTMNGAFFSGKHYKTIWEARRNDNATLKNADSLTTLLPGFDRLSFAFENPEGKLISLDDPAYQGKVKIIQLTGTWCPNCKDETEFLVDYLQKNTQPNLAVIALAFEKHADKAKANNAIRTYKNRLHVPYEVLLAGSNKKQEAVKSLPFLSEVFAFPTLLFLDKNNRVQKIHTGFSGPATSQYGTFQAEFDSFVKKLLNEDS